MSLPKDSLQGSLFTVGIMAPAMFAADDRYRVFREKILSVLYVHREQLCALYCEDNGRPAIEPVILGAVMRISQQIDHPFHK